MRAGLTYAQATPNICYYNSVSNAVMRHLIAGTAGDLVGSTGVMTVIETMQDGKLPFNQDLNHNALFISSYLVAIKSIFSSDLGIERSMFNLMVELSTLLFAPKPLTSEALSRTGDLLAMPAVTAGLKTINKKIVDKTCGSLAGRLLTFISNPNVPAELIVKRNEILRRLRPKDQSRTPTCEEGLKIAATQALLFELRVLLKTMSRQDINKKQSSDNHYTALHLAVFRQNTECIQELVKAGADPLTSDRLGKTPLDYAKELPNSKIYELLSSNSMVRTSQI